MIHAMESVSHDPTDASQWGTILEQYHQRMTLLQQHPTLGKRALGVKGWDATLWQLGQAWLKQATPAPTSAPSGGDVYLATQLYSNGGHTALIGDFINALDDSGGNQSHVLLTNVAQHNNKALPETIVQRLGIPAQHCHILRAKLWRERLDELMQRLLEIAPRRLFLFHHPEDPLASVAAQTAIAQRCVMVHHADATPSFGLHLPGVTVLELNPIAAAASRLLGLEPAMLPLTAPDPGSRPHGFLLRGKLTTASCGSLHKFTKPHVYGYPETVAQVLSTTAGWHVHIGPLDTSLTERIQASLEQAQITPDRFIHIPWTASLAECLWEQQCDLFLASFPLDGARTNMEVMASATPYLRHSLKRNTAELPGSKVWHTWEDLRATLQAMTSCEHLQASSSLLRQTYEALHHPKIFRATLESILLNGSGAADPDSVHWDTHCLQSLVKTLTTTALKQAEQIADLQQQVQALASSALKHPEGNRKRDQLLRWLLRKG
jgi:hypothetical protein